MIRFLITKENALEFPDYTKKFFNGTTLDMYITNNQFTVKSNSMITFTIYRYINDDYFIISNDYNQLVSTVLSKGFVLTKTGKIITGFNVRLSTFEYNEIEHLNNWNEITFDLNTGQTLYVDNSIKQQYSTLKLSVKELKCYLIKWFEKWKTLTNLAIDKNLLIPTLTGGLDTRVFFSLYKDRLSDIHEYYLKKTKDDGKFNRLDGEIEVLIAEDIFETFNVHPKRIEVIPKGKFTLSGKYIELYGIENCRSLDYLFLLQEQRSSKYLLDNFANTLIPYLDNDLLILDINQLIQQEEGKFLFRTLLYILFVDERISDKIFFFKHTFTTYDSLYYYKERYGKLIHKLENDN